MQTDVRTPSSDSCDEKLTKVDSPRETDRQRRFLDAYRQRPVIASAARLAGIHRATVYRWLDDPLFAATAKEAADAFFREHRAKAIAEEAFRQRQREARELERRPMRLRNLECARAAKCV